MHGWRVFHRVGTVTNQGIYYALNGKQSTWPPHEQGAAQSGYGDGFALADRERRRTDWDQSKGFA
jgi:hypothetical protein